MQVSIAHERISHLPSLVKPDRTLTIRLRSIPLLFVSRSNDHDNSDTAELQMDPRNGVVRVNGWDTTSSLAACCKLFEFVNGTCHVLNYTGYRGGCVSRSDYWEPHGLYLTDSRVRMLRIFSGAVVLSGLCAVRGITLSYATLDLEALTPEQFAYFMEELKYCSVADMASIVLPKHAQSQAEEFYELVTQGADDTVYVHVKNKRCLHVYM